MNDACAVCVALQRVRDARTSAISSVSVPACFYAGGVPFRGDATTVPLAEVVGRPKNVPLDSDTVQTARELGIALGD